MLFLSVLTLAASFAGGPAPSPWENEVVYQIFPRSYRDSNGDRHGDMQGIIQGLPEIQRLGCTAILINPVYKSRVYHNYFADDWFAIDPRFGTMDDFRVMVRAAHKRHIKVILDTEPQYVANGQKWFKAVLENPDSPFKDYLWNEDPKAKSWPQPEGQSWYNHAKVSLTAVNFDNPTVRQAILDHYKFWAATGLDGFRIDHTEDDFDWKGVMTDMLRKVWDPVVSELKRERPHMFFIAEQGDWEAIKDAFDILQKHDIDAIFGFRFRRTLLTFNKRTIEVGLDEANWYVAPGKTEFTFLENHDLDRFASVELDPRRQRLAAALLLTTKGTPSIYQGQELGMLGKQGKWGSDGNDIPVRLAYRWGKTLNSPGTAEWYKGTGPWASTGYSKDHDGISLEEETGNPRSLLNFYRKMIALRKGSPALLHGSQHAVSIENPFVLGFERATVGQRVLVLANLSSHPQTARLPAASRYTDLLPSPSRRSVPGSVMLEPWSFRVLARS